MLVYVHIYETERLPLVLKIFNYFPTHKSKCYFKKNKDKQKLKLESFMTNPGL